MRKTEDMRGEKKAVVTVTSNSQQTYLDNRNGRSKHALTTLLMRPRVRIHRVLPRLISLIVASMIYFSSARCLRSNGGEIQDIWPKN